MKIKTLFNIKGKVQGVGYRYFAYRIAKEFGITGYAKNIWDGSVEVVAEGDKDKIELLNKHLKQGPSMSRVTECIRKDYPFKSEFDTFIVY